jgi:hypothetical protein
VIKDIITYKTQRQMTLLERANRARVTPDLLDEVLVMHANLPPADRASFEVRTIRTFQMLDEKGLHDERADLAIAIEFRLAAMARVLEAGQANGWTLPSAEAGAELVHPSLVRGAAEEPLIEDASGGASFNPESFRRRVLAITQPKGTA